MPTTNTDTGRVLQPLTPEQFAIAYPREAWEHDNFADIGRLVATVYDREETIRQREAEIAFLSPRATDAPCYYCGESTSSGAGNPGLWPLYFPHTEEPGKVKPHHSKCVLERLGERDALRTAILDPDNWPSGIYGPIENADPVAFLAAERRLHESDMKASFEREEAAREKIRETYVAGFMEAVEWHDVPVIEDKQRAYADARATAYVEARGSSENGGSCDE